MSVGGLFGPACASVFTFLAAGLVTRSAPKMQWHLRAYTLIQVVVVPHSLVDGQRHSNVVTHQTVKSSIPIPHTLFSTTRPSPSHCLRPPLTMAMLPRAARPALERIARSSVTASFHSSAAQMATLRELEQRVKSVRNIEKITKVCRLQRYRGTQAGRYSNTHSPIFPRSMSHYTQSMKMIASTKLSKAQRAMQAARSYGKANEGA